MSIATKKGDSGITSLLFDRRVSKCHPRVEACGCVDELTSAIGLAKASLPQDAVRNHLTGIQKNLVTLMGELATATEDAQRYEKSGFSRITPGHTSALDQIVRECEAERISFKGWATPGANIESAALDFARTVCRRAERRVCALMDDGDLPNGEILVYLNRLSDVLWLLARSVEPRQ